MQNPKTLGSEIIPFIGPTKTLQKKELLTLRLIVVGDLHQPSLAVVTLAISFWIYVVLPAIECQCKICCSAQQTPTVDSNLLEGKEKWHKEMGNQVA